MWKMEDAGTWVAHRDNEPWHTAELAASLVARMFHRCTPQSIGVIGWEVIERCTCGAVRFGHTDPNMVTPWSPNAVVPLSYVHDGGWQERNSRHRGTAMFYYPHVRPLTEERP